MSSVFGLLVLLLGGLGLFGPVIAGIYLMVRLNGRRDSAAANGGVGAP